MDTISRLVRHKLLSQYPGIDLAGVQFSYKSSRKTGRIRSVLYKSELLFSHRSSDGRLLPTLNGAQFLISHGSQNNIITVEPVAESFIKEGRSLYCKHVYLADESIIFGSPVILQNKQKTLLATGIANQPGYAMLQLNGGVAVRVKHSLKSNL